MCSSRFRFRAIELKYSIIWSVSKNSFRIRFGFRGKEPKSSIVKTFRKCVWSVSDLASSRFTFAGRDSWASSWLVESSWSGLSSSGPNHIHRPNDWWWAKSRPQKRPQNGPQKRSKNGPYLYRLHSLPGLKQGPGPQIRKWCRTGNLFVENK